MKLERPFLVPVAFFIIGVLVSGRNIHRCRVLTTTRAGYRLYQLPRMLPHLTRFLASQRQVLNIREFVSSRVEKEPQLRPPHTLTDRH